MRRALVLALLSLLVLAGRGAPASAEPPASASGSAAGSARVVTLLQMNQCLSGYAGCFGRTAYPAVVDETVALVREQRADVVVLNESCSGDAARVARETGLHLTFSTVIYRGAALPCRTPEGRGDFGNAVLTRAEPLAVLDRAYDAQAGVEERRVACVVTRGLTACGTHLSTRGGEGAAANDAQCAELEDLMRFARRVQPVLVAGDVNRQPGCAAPGFWTRTDAAAAQAPGIQHVYGARSRVVGAQVVPATYTDHDVLVVRARVS